MAKRGKKRKSAPVTFLHSASKSSEAATQKAEPFSDLEISRIEHELEEIRGWSKAILFKKFEDASPGLCAKDTFQKLLSPTLGRRMPAQPYHRTTLARALGWTAEEFGAFLRTGIAPSCGIRSAPDATNETVPLSLAADEKPDRKDVIIDPQIRAALLAGKPRSLLSCVEATEMRWLRNQEKRNCHFFGISTVLFVELPARTQPLLLSYQRKPKAGISEPRQGLSILFHASFTREFPGAPSPADRWVELANKDPKRARDDFVRIPGGTLLELIEYKVKFPPGIEGTCRPLGVISRDLRATEESRVYTQYVFETVISSPKVTTVEGLKAMVAVLETQKEGPVSFSEEDLQPEFFLSGRSVKTMDYLALSALRGAEPRLECGDSKFTRDFKIL